MNAATTAPVLIVIVARPAKALSPWFLRRAGEQITVCITASTGSIKKT